MSETDPSDAFYLQYGRTLAAWTGLEQIFSWWFTILTKLPAPMAERIFFSGKNFNTRRGLLIAAIDTAQIRTETRMFLRQAVKKATDFSQQRNIIAHDVTVGFPDIDSLAIVPGHKMTSSVRVTIASLKEAGDNIRILTGIISDGFENPLQQSRRSHEECLRLIQELPNQAYSTVEIPYDEARSTPQQSSPI